MSVCVCVLGKGVSACMCGEYVSGCVWGGGVSVSAGGVSVVGYLLRVCLCVLRVSDKK